MAAREQGEIIRFGVPGLDEVIDAGIPPKTLFLVEGPPGSGKTTLALQFLLHGARNGETSLLVSNAESPEQLKRIAATHGWSLDGIEIVEWTEPAAGETDNDPDYTLFPEAEVEVGETLRHLFAEVERVRPTRLVIDTISALRALAPTPAFYRRQLRRIRDVLSAHDCTTLIIDDATGGDKDIRSQTLADAILELYHLDFLYGGDRRRLRVRKLRGAGYVGGLHDFRIKRGGVVVYPRLVAARHAEAALSEGASSGIEALDTMSGGGLPRGSSTLIMGPAGTGKSTVATSYLRAAARRGEQCAICLFDESPETFVARSRSLGMDIAGDVEAGLIRMNHLDPAEFTPGEISHLIVQWVEDGARLVVIDALNGYLQSAAEEPMVLLHLRELLSYLARRQVLTLLILTRHGLIGTDLSTPVDASFPADNVFLLSYFESDGRIRQALAMVKRRVGRHERTIRELTMTGQGISLSPPLSGFAGVLRGHPQCAPAMPDA